jgi:GNAT superfamily N-acetyltransferase
MVTYTYRKMSVGDLAGVERFIRDRMAAGRYPHRSGWLAWQYLDNPSGFDVRLCESDQGLVGVSGFIPCRLQIDGQLRTAAFSTNTLVDERHRRNGIGQRFHELRLQDYDVALSSGQSPGNRRIYAKLGFVECGRYRRFMAQARLPERRLEPRFVTELWAWLRWRVARRRHRADLRVEISPRAPAAAPDCYRERFEAGAIGPVWTHDHVVWRYERHPYFRYQFLQVFRARQPLGFAVVRDTGATTVLTDAYCRASDLHDVLAGIVQAPRCRVTGQVVGRALERRFRHSGWTTRPATNRLLGKSNDPALHRLLLTRSWCFFGGDSDSDR